MSVMFVLYSINGVCKDEGQGQDKVAGSQRAISAY